MCSSVGKQHTGEGDWKDGQKIRQKTLHILGRACNIRIRKLTMVCLFAEFVVTDLILQILYWLYDIAVYSHVFILYLIYIISFLAGNLGS
jgi:hypothetical protein